MEQKGYINELVSYIKKNLKKGYTKDSLKWALVAQGHSKIEVDKALRITDLELAKDAPFLRTKPEIKYEILEPPNAIIEKKPFWKKWLGL